MTRDVTLLYGEGVSPLDLTDFLASVQGGTSGRTVETSANFVLNLRDDADTLVLDEEREIKLLIGGHPWIRAWITSIDRQYVSDGVPNDNTPQLLINATDIYGRLRRRIWPPPTTGLKRAPGDLARDRLIWLVGKINSHENAMGRGDLLVLDTDEIQDALYRFDPAGFPPVDYAQEDYYSSLFSAAGFAGTDLTIGPDGVPRTRDAWNPELSPIEIYDGDSLTGVDPFQPGNTVIGGTQRVGLGDESIKIVNRVWVAWGADGQSQQIKWLKVEDTASIARWGVFEKTLPAVDTLTHDFAEALGRKELAHFRNPEVRGSIKLRWTDANDSLIRQIRVGTMMNLHLPRFGNGTGGYIVRQGYLRGMTPELVKAGGGLEAVAVTLSFAPDPFEPPTIGGLISLAFPTMPPYLLPNWEMPAWPPSEQPPTTDDWQYVEAPETTGFIDSVVNSLRGLEMSQHAPGDGGEVWGVHLYSSTYSYLAAGFTDVDQNRNQQAIKFILPEGGHEYRLSGTMGASASDNVFVNDYGVEGIPWALYDLGDFDADAYYAAQNALGNGVVYGGALAPFPQEATPPIGTLLDSGVSVILPANQGTTYPNPIDHSAPFVTAPFNLTPGPHTLLLASGGSFPNGYHSGGVSIGFYANMDAPQSTPGFEYRFDLALLYNYTPEAVLAEPAQDWVVVDSFGDGATVVPLDPHFRVRRVWLNGKALVEHLDYDVIYDLAGQTSSLDLTKVRRYGLRVIPPDSDPHGPGSDVLVVRYAALAVDETMSGGYNLLGPWSSGTTYQPGDVVTSGTHIWSAKRVTIGDTPASSPLDWVDIGITPPSPSGG